MSTKRELYIVRHGDAEKYNQNGEPLEDASRRLSPNGVTEVTQLATYLREIGVKPHLIISSLLTRAIETATIIAQHTGSPLPITSELIGEADLGNLPNTKEALLTAEYGYNTPLILEAGGETVEEVEKRVTQFLYELSEYEAECIIVVSHGFTLSVMSQLLQGLARNFSTIQVLKTSDYSYFVMSESEPTRAHTAKTNVFRGKPSL